MTPAAPSSPSFGHGFALALGALVLAAWTAVMGVSLKQAALEEEAGGTVLAVFPPSTPTGEAFAAVIRAGGEPLRQTWIPFAWVVRAEGDGFVGRLKREGAVTAYGELPVGPVLGGCAVVSLDDKRPVGFQFK
ncbi:hypothetical protein [Azospirillum rugosum]|uniref:Uncharacterized protein n=1 Tax=Azospirillum rugosum TaxID=416170 RepID=A0ABS4SRQ7_9PROT|nr:hypothetical protein [Azospirillum rugosum]MBP2294904.1 hypothetical protein [Azospirillum rugosum]MDQ0528174.1 hypothetical protein [Azospirillum rugosum]